MENSWQVFKKLNIELPYDPEIPLLGIYPNELKMYIHTTTWTQMFIAALFIMAKKYNNTNIHQMMSK